MTGSSQSVHAPDMETSRMVSTRYFNLYRLLIATTFVMFGSVLDFGQSMPSLYLATVSGYWFLAMAIVIATAVRPRVAAATVGVQVSIDILALTLFMYASGGYRSGIPFLMMTTIAGAALVGQGSTVLGVTAFATIAVLMEQLLRAFLRGLDGVDFSRAAIICVGFFAVALVARMLARRALANEALALRRGADLERQMRVNARIIEDMQDGVIVIDEQGIVRLYNPRAEALTGTKMQSGVRLSEHLPTLQAFAMGSASGDTARLSVDDKSRALNVRRVLVGNGRDTLLYLEDLDRIQAQAQQLKLAALGRLTANIAHEIRNPLSSISHAGDLLKEEKRAAMQQRLIRIIHDNAARIERMVRDVLEVGRRDRAVIERLNVGHFLRSFFDEFALHTSSAATAMSLTVQAGCEIEFDRVHLYQILSNLAANACRYCSGQPGSICITAHPIDDKRVVISIRDDGPGIAEEDRMKVFEPFFTSDPKGTGLGLYMARELAEANGGLLRLVEAAGGAEFELVARRAI